MSAADLRINNTIFLMHLVSGAYARAHHLTRSEFVRYVSQCPDVFDSLPEDEIVKEVDAYVNRCA